MPVRPIEWGKPFPSLNAIQLRDGIAQSAINCYLDIDGSYVKRPGKTLFKDLSSANTVRGLFRALGGTVLVVCNGVIKTMASNGDLTAWTGDNLTAGNPVIWAEDESNVFAAHGGHLTKLTLGTTVAAVLAGNSPAAVSHVVFADHYLLTNGTGSLAGDEFYSDDKANGYTAADSWESFNNEAVPDACTGVADRWNQNYALGTYSIEVNVDDGVTPWARSTAPNIEMGVYSAHTWKVANGTFYWLGYDKKSSPFCRLEGYTAVPIASPYDGIVAGYTDRSSAYSHVFAINGADFYLTTFPTTDISLCYNTRTDSWSQWSYYTGTPAAHTADLMGSTTYSTGWNKQLIGSRAATGLVYYMGGLTDNGVAIRMELISGNISRGTLLPKCCNSLLFKWKSASANSSFSYRFKDEGGSWSSYYTITPDLYAADTYHSMLPCLGSYRERQHHVVHDGTDTDFTLVSVEEDYTVLR